MNASSNTVKHRKDFKDLTKPCKYCGKIMHRRYYPNSNRHSQYEDIRLFNKRKYCSILCMRKDWVNLGVNESSIRNSRSSARNIYQLFIGLDRCSQCGATENLDVHHIDQNPNNNSIDNLMLLCRSCHMKLHHPKPTCKICGNPVKGYGFCNKHYLRYKKYGDPMFTKYAMKQSDYAVELKGGDAHDRAQ